ncbi:coiled-coil domain-containing protein 114 [Stegastes partitus]|uniref:Coiled-coil domain-containing protein 114 n=1 Tax=Stegastes partitus TaxID=144197 RepID=A0A9Y4K5A9_9TELE|nr:PREDICTED: coiled-coil domain-containing protein 63-like [Stegastes partitus]
MNRGRAAADSDQTRDTDSDAEAELAKLQRRYRIMERDQQAYKVKAQRELRKQEQVREQLLKEQDELHQQAGVSKNPSHQQQDSREAQHIRALLQEGDALDEEIENEMQRQHGQQKEILKMELKLAELPKGEACWSAAGRSGKQLTQKLMRNLLCKLDEALTCFNEQITVNKQLREEVQTLHTERVRFQQLRNRLNKELQEVRKKIQEDTSLASAVYDARAEAQSKMTTMLEKAEKERVQYNAEMKELQRVIAHDSSLKGFMGNKYTQLSELKDQNRMDSEEESPDALEEMFKGIQILTEQDSVDQPVTRVAKPGDVYNFVTEQNKEIEALRKEISQVREEMEQYRAESLEQDQDHRSRLRDADEKRHKAEAQAEEYENQANSMSSVLDEIMTGINSIFSKMECERSVAEETLGSSAGVTENNFMFYLGLLEQKTNELLTIQAFLTSKDPEKDYNPKDLAKILLGQNPELLQQSMSIQPAVDRVDYDAEERPITEEEEQPLSQAELRQRILKKKESSARPPSTKASKTGLLLADRRRSLEDVLI